MWDDLSATTRMLWLSSEPMPAKLRLRGWLESPHFENWRREHLLLYLGAAQPRCFTFPCFVYQGSHTG